MTPERGGPFEVRFRLSASENPHYYAVTLDRVFQVEVSGSLRGAKQKAKEMNKYMAYWLKTPSGRSWMAREGIGGKK